MKNRGDSLKDIPPIEHFIDEGWQKSLAWHWEKIQEAKGVSLFTAERQKIRTFGVLAEIPEEAKRQINAWLDDRLPRQYDGYIIRQPADQYHISLEWTEQENIQPENKGRVLADIKNELSKFSKIKIDIALVYPSFVNLFAPCLMDNAVLEKMRDSLRTVFDNHNLRIGIPKEVYGAWISLARFKKQLPPELIEGLKHLPKDTVPGVVLDDVLLTVNDPMFTKENSPVLEQVPLK